MLLTTQRNDDAEYHSEVDWEARFGVGVVSRIKAMCQYNCFHGVLIHKWDESEMRETRLR